MKKVPWILTVSCLLFVLAFGGCARPEVGPELVDRSGEGVIKLPVRHQIVGRSVQGRPIMCQVFGEGPDVVLIMGTIHGDEPAGTPLVRCLSGYLKENPYLLDGRMVVLMPLTNPDGRVLGTRENARGVDLNRNFDASNRIDNTRNGREALSEPESRVIRDMIQRYRPNRIVSLHQRRNGRPSCIDYDGPADSLAQHMARYCDVPVSRLGMYPGSLGSYMATRLGIPVITFEMFESDSRLTAAVLWQRYGRAMLAAIVYPNDL